tara:strand:+ start:242 stop:514 length:273 start_codon:yes stop_codon:yes gene_type:complete
MFTVKVCNPGSTLYFETAFVSTEALKNDLECLRFESQGHTHSIILHDFYSDSADLECFTKAQRVYLMNDQGKTIDVFRYTPKFTSESVGE